MVSYRQKMAFIALIISITIPISTAHRRRRLHDSDDTEQTLRDLCSQTHNSDVCWNILKSDLHRFDDCGEGIANGVIDLAVQKSKQIRDTLNQWFRDSNDEDLKKKYHSCSKNYNDVSRNLQEVNKNLDSDDNRKTSDQIDNAENELDKCRRVFGKNSADPGHVGDRNNELGLYLEIVRVAADRLGDYYDGEDRN